MNELKDKYFELDEILNTVQEYLQKCLSNK